MYLIRERFFRLGEDSDITDEHGQPVLHVDGKVLSLRNRLVLGTPRGMRSPRSSASWSRCGRATRSRLLDRRPPRSANACSHPSVTGSQSTSPGPMIWRYAATCRP
jgi:hypothetical protein